jgi:hypothetical protein
MDGEFFYEKLSIHKLPSDSLIFLVYQFVKINQKKVLI